MELLAGFFRQAALSSANEYVIASSLVLVRILAFLHMAPIFGHKGISLLTRIGLSIFLTMIILNSIDLPSPPSAGYYLPWAVLVNVSLGLLIGFVAKLMFETVVSGGEMMDSSMGFSSAQTFDPHSGAQTTIMGKFMSSLAIVVFFFVHGPERLIESLYKSFSSVNIYAPSFSVDALRIVHLVGDIISMGFIIVSPIILTIMVGDIILGLISRASPQINAFQISYTIKPSIGVIVFLLIMPLFFMGLFNFFGNSGRLLGFN